MTDHLLDDVRALLVAARNSNCDSMAIDAVQESLDRHDAEAENREWDYAHRTPEQIEQDLEHHALMKSVLGT